MNFKQLCDWTNKNLTPELTDYINIQGRLLVLMGQELDAKNTKIARHKSHQFDWIIGDGLMAELDWELEALHGFECDLNSDRLLKKHARQYARFLQRLFISQAQKTLKKSPFIANLNLLKQRLGLSEVDTKLLEIIFIYQREIGPHICRGQDLSNNIDTLLIEFSGQVISRQYIANICRGHENPLFTSGMIKLSLDGENWHDMLELHSKFDKLISSHFELNDLLYPEVKHKRPKPELKACDFSHIKNELTCLTLLVRHALTNQQRLNILLVGQAGSGKNELVYHLTKQFKLSLTEISTSIGSGFSGDQVTESDRLSNLLCYNSLAAHNHQSIVLLDEVDELFVQANSGISFKMRSSVSKVQLVYALDSVNLITFWVCNHKENIEEAFLRRFDFILDMPKLNQQQRRKMVKRIVGTNISAELEDELVKIEQASPAFYQAIAKSFKVVTDAKLQQTLLHTYSKGLYDIDNPKDANKNPPVKYLAELLNTNVNAAELIAGIKRSKQARILLAGVPGAGKTEFCRFIAEQLKMPLIRKTPSDIQDKYIGETEVKIANTFAGAYEQNAVLLFDEADGLLRTRESANQSWEISQINEFLAQLENFDGICFVATNFPKTLDLALQRRFDFNVFFDYLTHAQLCKAVALDTKRKLTSAQQNQLKQLTKIAPGDLTKIRRQARVIAKPLNFSFVFEQLKIEESLKNGGKRKMGF
ncbi:AAA family ATPase [Catenovulum agarivorans]|uniref:AAA family ATPase n=1 Tax=Catenovulum agarivorans TaxID=1172192 RepID=UPI0002DC9CC8|nr:ATP-binding protein [Catenovulum agarivorans]